MASGPAQEPQEQAPALPVKQHRSISRSSSLDADSVRAKLELQHHDEELDVFMEVADCQAAQCPIHRCPDHSRHQVFSNDSPPPVPKKRLTRSISLPVNAATYQTPFQKYSINFGNPLYMLATTLTEAMEETEPIRRGVDASLSLSEVTFDTPDEQLLVLFSGLSDQRLVSQRVQHHQLLFLRRLTQSLAADVLIDGGTGPYLPQDFVLSEGKEPKQLGDSVYYSVRSSKFPGRDLALRVQKMPAEVPSGQTVRLQPSHINVQDVIVVFRHDAPASQPHGGRSDPLKVTVEGLLQGGHRLSVERDLPAVTLEDFVQQGGDGSLHDRRVCVLLLQILVGCQHLRHTSTSAPDLRPQDIHLTWPSKERSTGGGPSVQMLWRTRGSPRVVLSPQSAPHTSTQMRHLIQYCLFQQGGATTFRGTSTPYRRGLLHLESLLQGEGSAPQTTDMVALLQVLLWGPRVPHGGAITCVHNWLTVKRALLLMKLAERGLIQEQPVLDWEDCLCLQYLSSADPETVMSASRHLAP